MLGACAGAWKIRAAQEFGPSLYESIGINQVINCNGTLTTVSGSLVLPEGRSWQTLPRTSGTSMS